MVHERHDDNAAAATNNDNDNDDDYNGIIFFSRSCLFSVRVLRSKRVHAHILQGRCCVLNDACGELIENIARANYCRCAFGVCYGVEFAIYCMSLLYMLSHISHGIKRHITLAISKYESTTLGMHARTKQAQHACTARARTAAAKRKRATTNCPNSHTHRVRRRPKPKTAKSATHPVQSTDRANDPPRPTDRPTGRQTNIHLFNRYWL